VTAATALPATIVACGPAHAAILALLHAATFPEDPWTTASFATLLEQPGMFACIDERGGFLLLRIIADEAEIITLGATTKRLGIGRTLLETAIAQTRAAGAKKLHLEVAEQNTAARALYASAGFTQTGRRPAYYPDGSAALTLCLAIQPKAP
jgi:ribosomal-protein-alanine N-acetyltransferase